MPEPTIKELIDYIGNVEVVWGGSGELTAIRAILEQQREYKKELKVWDATLMDGLEDEPVELPTLTAAQVQAAIELAAIRAFVERVEKRLPDYNTGKGADSWLKAYRLAVMDELAEMEKGPGASHAPQDRPS